MKKYILAVLAILYFNCLLAQSNIGIGTATPNNSAILDISSTTKGLLIPRMTTAERTAIVSPANGLLVYDTQTNSMWYYNVNAWTGFTASGALTFPYAATVNTNLSAFKITNQGFGAGIEGGSVSDYGIGLIGSTTGVGGWGVNASATRDGAIGLYAFSDSGTVINASNNSTGNTNTLLNLTNYGLGKTASFQLVNTASTSPSVQIASNGLGKNLLLYLTNPANVNTGVELNQSGIGSGITVNLTNPSNGSRGLDIQQLGVGPGVFATSAGGNAVWGITSGISAVGVLGDNTYGIAVMGRTRGGQGVAGVEGRNDSSGYGVRGFNTHDGIGVLGQAGISGGTGVGGRFENVNAANANNALEAKTNGTGWAANFSSTNNSTSSRGLRLATTGGAGGTALQIANGNFTTAYTLSYSSGAVVDDPVLVVSSGNSISIPTGAPSIDGTHIWVVNNTGGVLNVTNTMAGTFAIAQYRAQQFLLVSTVSAVNWIPVQ